MTDHILTSTKKCIPDSSGRFFSSGGPAHTAYGNFEEDYFIIRRSDAVFAATPNIVFTPRLWDVRDYSGTVTTEYDFIDVFTSTTGWPNSWTWQTRIGGTVYNVAAANMDPTDIYYLTGQHIKFCFVSKGRSNSVNKGWQIDWSSSAAAVGTLWSTGEAAANYSDITNIKENCGDNIFDRDGTFGTNLFNRDYFTEIDPGNENWEYLPQGQLSTYAEDSRGITVMPWALAQLNFAPVATVGTTLQTPISYTATDRRKIATLGDITIGRGGNEEK